MNIFLRTISFFILLLLPPAWVMSQTTKKSGLEFSGVILDKSSTKKNANVKISVTDLQKANASDSVLYTGENGSFKFRFEIQKEYLLTFEKKGYIRKKILLNTAFPNENNKIITNFFEIMFQMSDKMPSNYGGELLDKPFGKIVYIPAQKLFDYDPVYASEIKKELNKLSADQIEKLTNQRENPGAQITPVTQATATQVAPVVSKVVAPVPQPKAADDKSLKSPVEKLNNMKTVEIKKTAGPLPDIKIEQKTETKNLQEPPKSPIFKGAAIAIETYKVNTKTKNAEHLFFENEIEKREITIKKTVLEITDRKKIIYETFLQQKILRKSEAKKKKNASAKYTSENPLTSFMNVTDCYEKGFFKK
jgi:hypothetical protein